MSQTKFTSHELKKINGTKIYQYIYQEKSTSRPDIAHALQMSFPTVTQNLTLLEENGLIQRTGFQESTGGRKAQTITCCADAKIAIGIHLLKEFVNIVAIDLYGTILDESILNLSYINDSAYFEQVCQATNSFIQALSYPASKILGIGIAFQGLVSADGRTITYGKILQCTGLTLEEFSSHLSFPCIFIHDAKAASSAELWFQPEITDAIYLSLNRYLGSAVIINGSIHHGSSMISGTIEHTCLVPDGKPCYCGKKGCLEAYCSAYSLKHAAGIPIEQFFYKLRQGDLQMSKIWHTYLCDLARGIANIRHIIDTDFIIGGLLNSYFTGTDYALLADLAEEYSGIPVNKPRIIPSAASSEVAAIGAGLYYIRNFLDTI